MAKPRLNPEAQQALDHLLEGEFDYFGLISSQRTLSAPVLGWSYQRTHGRSQRTVSCHSLKVVPHADDAAVMRTAVYLYAQRPVEQTYGLLEVSVDAFFQQLAVLFPAVKLTDAQLIEALGRLFHAYLEVTYVMGEDKSTRTTTSRHFKLFSTLMSFRVQDSNSDRFESVVFMVTMPALQLYLAGSYEPLF
ncbi:hypothetical protein [Deinococcus alpinitundrae]|uniref:hypothetical protein n=1 Tax=Deinococcus alpinitundrae TaxID=468913 RepID=UPI00137A87CD|nr:hypothetical protein [Deinococcus alpinitundrae]